MKFKSNEDAAQTLLAIREYLGQWGIESYEGERLLNAIDEALTQLKRWMRVDEVTMSGGPSVLGEVENQLQQTMEAWRQQMSTMMGKLSDDINERMGDGSPAKRRNAAKPKAGKKTARRRRT